jgi:Arc/MetJ family transcription regulator
LYAALDSDIPAAKRLISVLLWDPIRAERQALNTASNDDIYDVERIGEMRTTVSLDDELVAKAQFYTGIREKSALIREALKALVAREAGRRLARLGGSEPGLKKIPRRRPKPA